MSKIKIRDEAFQFYFYFIEERMSIFWKKKNGTLPLTDDPIFSTYKFTNVYRVLDRVTQYLLKKVIYQEENSFSDEDVLFRILIFKIFNKMETWEFLEEALEQPICRANFRVGEWSELLSYRIRQQPIFNGAYMMTGSHRKYRKFPSKHEKWLRMVEKEFIENDFFTDIKKADSLEEVYHLLLSRSFIGEFLAYQYAIDFNYSPVIDFDENTFVKAGIGAKRGIHKCFSDFGGHSYEDLIRYTQDHFMYYQEKYGYTNFKDLYGRPPTLIDLQNCFCEVDKYLRVKLPQLNQGQKRIKQKYQPSNREIELFFPSKVADQFFVEGRR
jgi:hypothetical protein